MIGLIGINFKTSPINIREKFSLDEKAIIEFASILKSKSEFSGLVVLSTCNRSEYYFHISNCCESSAFSYLLKNLKKYCGIKENVRDYFYFKSGEEAYRHLFRVVSGANSMVIGEDQIVGQVKQALKISVDNNLSDTELTRLFTKSFEVSKKVRTQTKINKGAFSVSYAGVEKCISVFPDIKNCNILLIGAGETGELTLKSLKKKGCDKIIITNRTTEKAEKLAYEYKVNSMLFYEYKTKLSTFDIIIVSTGSKQALINKTDIKNSIKNRNNVKQLYIDLSVPRNIDYSASAAENAIIYDVDDLQEIVNNNQEKRRKLISEIDKITDIYIEEFSNWLSARTLKPIISKIVSNFSIINKKETEGFKKANKLENETLIENYGELIADKYSRKLIKNLKEVTQNGKKTEYINILNELFEIN